MSDTPKTPTLREMLDQIDEWFLTERGADLAAVLSAIRGPDVFDQSQKDRLTNVIRREAFPKAFARAMRDTEIGWAVSTTAPEFNFLPGEGWNGTHYVNHVKMAAIVLRIRPQPPNYGDL